jgi:hypothetical protein
VNVVHHCAPEHARAAAGDDLEVGTAACNGRDLNRNAQSSVPFVPRDETGARRGTRNGYLDPIGLCRRLDEYATVGCFVG